ncbi:MAG: hypothetical protein WDM77_06080 [Steroidobacteraceae bacterium]
MKILSIAAAVTLSTVSLSALAKDADQAGVAESAFAYTAVAGSQSVTINTTIEGSFSSQTAVAIASARAITAGGGRLSVSGAGRSVSGAGRSVSGAGRSVSGAGRSVSGAGRSVSGAGRSVSGAGRSVSGAGR